MGYNLAEELNCDIGWKPVESEKPDSPGNTGRAAIMSACSDGSRCLAHRSPVCLCEHICRDPSPDAKLLSFFAAV